MTKRVLVCVALAIGCLGQIAVALPDLGVARLEISPATPTDGALVTVIATIENTGTSDVDDPFFVRFHADGREIDIMPVTSLRSGRAKTLTTTWTATAGPHVLSVEVDDSSGGIDEADKGNKAQEMYVSVRLAAEVLAILEPLKIAVARFDDVSGSGFVNVGEGVADELIERFAVTGLRVLDRAELEDVMQTHGLNPAVLDDVAIASQLIGADLLVLGSVANVSVQETTYGLGFLRLESASVDVSLSARVVDVYTSQTLSFLSADGHDDGTTGFSIDLGQLLSSLTAGPTEVCSGGLQTHRSWYNPGQPVLLGYQNDGAPTWFGIEIYSSTGAFLRWLGWEFIQTDECETWSWDQRNASGLPMTPGIYSAKLWDGTSYVETVGFQIRPGISLVVPVTDEITIGNPLFDETVVGTAMNQAIDRLTSVLLRSLESLAPGVLDRGPPLAAAAMTQPGQGQIAAILPDGRIAINLGASSGVTEGDVFEVLEVTNLVVDPQTSEILAYDVVSVKGEIRITEAREQVSYAVLTGSFAPVIGDVVRAVP